MTPARDQTPAELEKRAPARTHGARSEAQIRPRARTAKQRLLRQVGLSASQLDGIARGYLDNWARAQAKVELMDKWIEAKGLVDSDGNLPGFMATYFAALNSARLALAKLEDHLRQRGGEPSMVAVLQGTARRIG